MLASELPAWIVRLTAFLFGALWGSFFNVAIYRWPRDMSVVTPPSHCPACGKPVPPWRNVPIVAYLVQRGRAACCGAKMTPRYLAVEVLSGVVAIAIAERFFVHADESVLLGSAAIETVLWFVFAGGLIIATFVDLEWMEIPDEVSIGGAALALATVAWRPSVPIEEVVLGAGGGYLLVHLLLVWSWEHLTGKRGMGEGDAKLAMFIGAFVGWKGALFALVAGSFQGIIGWAIARAAGAKIGPAASSDASAEPKSEAAANEPAAKEPEPTKEPEPANDTAANDDTKDAEADPDAARRIPFGPFLALGAIEYLFFGDRLVDWYLSLFE